MKAYALSTAEQPASLIDIPEPEVGPDDVRVRVRAASVNGFDVYQASGGLAGMMEHIFPTTVGRDFAGIVETVGSRRDDVAEGDEVLGFVPGAPPLHDGSYAETVTARNLVLAPKPANVSFEAAAAIPLAAATALDSVDAVDVRPGQIVVVAGATGGVGSIVVQLAAQRGATVVATAKPGDEDELVRRLGAAETVDYGSGDVAEALRARYPDGVDALVDMVNRDDAFAAMVALIRPGGRVATTLGAADIDALKEREIHATNVMGAPTTEKLAALAAQVADGRLSIEVQATYPLEDAASALAAFAAGARGKLVLTVA